MANKKLADIRADLAAELEASGLDPGDSFEQRIIKLEGKTKPRECEIEKLNQIRDALASLGDTVEQK